MPTSEDAEPASSMPLALQSVFFKVGASQLAAAAGPADGSAAAAAGTASIMPPFWLLARCQSCRRCRCCAATTKPQLLPFSPVAQPRMAVVATVLPSRCDRPSPPCTHPPRAAPVHGGACLHKGPHPLLWVGYRRRLSAARRAGAEPHPVRQAGGEDEGERGAPPPSWGARLLSLGPAPRSQGFPPLMHVGPAAARAAAWPPCGRLAAGPALMVGMAASPCRARAWRA